MIPKNSIHPRVFVSRSAAMFSENRERVKIAGNVREEALRALEIEPENDLAIHILGRWELEMVRTPSVEMFLFSA